MKYRVIPAALLIASGAMAQDVRSLVLSDVRVVDIARGAVSAPVSVVISDGAIAAIGTLDDIAPGSAIHDAKGQFLIPGLWDSHVHLFTSADEPETAFRMAIVNGVTGLRDMGALWPIADQQALRDATESGATVGPRLILSGAWVDASPGSWPGMFLADTPTAAQQVVARIADEGWDAVKAYSMLDGATYAALAEAAHRAGLKLVGHVPERVTLSDALDAGQDGIEHFGRVTKACSPRERAMVDRVATALDADNPRDAMIAEMTGHNRIVLDTWDAALCGAVLARMARAGMHVSPTLVVAGFYTGRKAAPDSPRMRMLPQAVRDAWAGPDFRLDAMTDDLRAIADAAIALDHRTLALAHAAGVPILASTDASFANPQLFHGFSLLDELDLYVAAGLTPREALYTATVAPPRFFRLRDQDGSIAPGRRADLVLLDANPLEGLATLRDPAAVILRGVMLDRGALAEMRAADPG
ncbi:amidohydrolase family protein [Thalassococcus sp. CAU 1522]|uniref:Amidohydrolase family protein n=1 Tax=Thalassococcus arenae TaxID=2851652 RepID=A0ABS6N6N1_9RHOB|nr:amidohydrolase family protein [Thalassococcus arenae]MBV2359677.1 amidohydrolase family protein [Thalassococcus arenae]